MAIRQYIGARYVPKFMGNYDATQSYEALSVVDNGMGTSYITKIPTPANTPLTDTNYWAVYGATSGAIINLQNQINDMNDGTVTGSLQNQIDEMKDPASIGSLQYQINLVSNKRFIIIGDSYAERINSDGVKLSTLIARLCSVDTSDATKFYDLSLNGIGFTNDNGVGTFLNQLQSASISDPDTITDIMVIGGANDYLSNESAIGAAIGAFFTYARTNFINAKIYVGCISRSINTRSGMIHHADVTLPSYKNSTLANGGIYLANTEYIMHYSLLYESDKTHPTPTAVNYLARGISQAYNTGAAQVSYEVNPVLSGNNPTWSYNSIVGPAIYQFVENGISGMKCGDSYFRLDSAGVSLSASTTIADFVSLSVYTMLGFTTPTRGITIPCEVRIYNGGTYVNRVDGFVIVNDHGGLDLEFRTEGISPVTNVNQLHVVVGGSVVCPSKEC